MHKLRMIVDANVVFEGLTKKGGASGLLIDAWRAGMVEICISNALAYEYADVLSRKLSAERWRRLRPVLGALLSQAHFTPIYYSWRPMSPDPGDEHIIDCAMNTAGIVVTINLKDFETAREALGLAVMTPAEAVVLLSERSE